MQAGRLNQRVELLRREVSTSSSGSGAAVESFMSAGSVWCEVKPVSGNEAFLADQRFASTTHVFRMRYRGDVRTTWRLRWRESTYDIAEILPGGSQLREWLEVRATASPAENRT